MGPHSSWFCLGGAFFSHASAVIPADLFMGNNLEFSNAITSMSARGQLRTTPARPAIMSRIRAKDTKPEIMVRRILHGLGYRSRLHVRHLPRCPDIVLPKHRTIIQVKGCFWQCGHR